jgi:hypothetical protein
MSGSKTTSDDQDEEFDRFYQEASSVSDIGLRRIRDVFTREDARYLFDQLKQRELALVRREGT